MADNLSITKVLDPRLRTDIDNEYIAVIGADNWVKYRFGASALSNTQMAFNNIKPAGERFMINTRWYIEYTARIILTCDNEEGSGNMLVKGKFGFRPWPLQSCVINTLLRLNNKDFNTREQLWLFPILQYTPADKLNKLYSFMPHRKCKTQEFEDSFGTNHNPLAGYGDFVDDTGNGMVCDMNIVSNTNNRAELVVTIREPVIAEPLNYESGTNYGHCMWSVSNLELNLQFGPLYRMICLANAKDLNNLDMNVTLSDAYLLLDVATPPAPPPNQWLTGYCERNVFQTAIGEVQPNETKTITSAVYTLSYHPQHIYIYVAEDFTEYNNVQKAVRSTDTFARINKISITYGNNTKLMDEFDEHYLYQTALNNGLMDTTYADTGVINSDMEGNKVGMTGLCLKITPGIDLILPGEVICGGMAAESTTFQIQVTFTNINQQRPLKMCLYMCFENTGAVSLIPNGGDINMIPISNPSVVASAPATTLKDEEIFGGSFFDKIKKGLSVVNNFAKKTGIVSKALKYIPNIGPTASNIASSLGYGIPGYGTDCGGALNYEGGALNIRGGQVVPGPAFATKY